MKLKDYKMSTMDASMTPGPRCKLESEIMKLSQLMRDTPTIPHCGQDEVTTQQSTVHIKQNARQFPKKHCAFIDCTYGCDSDRDLLSHIHDAHFKSLQPVVDLLPLPDQNAPVVDENAILSAYNEAISYKCRQGAPYASCSIDRRCLYNYASAISGSNIQSLICLCCARRFLHISTRASNPISWETLLSKSRDTSDVLFLGLNAEETHEIFSMYAYLIRYGKCTGGPNLRDHPNEFIDWALTIPFSNESSMVLCCPDDRHCSDKSCMDKTQCCMNCQAPLCHECKHNMRTKKGQACVPPASLRNDMMIFDAPRELYINKVTILEMICASVCMTSMICFSLEKKYRAARPYDATVHMNRHGMGARGNASSFPFPWQDMLEQLHKIEQNIAPDLPIRGETLSNLVSVLLKT